MKNVLQFTYADIMLSLHTGRLNGSVAVSKPLYIMAIIDAIELDKLTENRINLDNEFMRKRFGQLYEQVNGNKKGNEISFFVRPFFHLGSSFFYHLIWQRGINPPTNSTTPSAQYLRENLLYAKLDDELWDLLQDAESRKFLKQSIIKRYLTK